jgi:hypothetical protein
MHLGSRTLLAWLVFLATLACLVGGLVVTIGWLYAAAGLVWTLYIPWDPWVDQLLRSGRPLPPAGRLAALAGDSLWAVGITLAITLPLLLLPSGRLRSPAGGWSRSPPSPAPLPRWSAGPWPRTR